jgi:phage terminase large subunit GpA-like protein
MVRRKTAGFWIVGVMSPFLISGIGGLARARVKAERDYLVSGEDQTLRQVITKQMGLPYTPPRALGSVTANDLADRADQRLVLGFVPDGVRFLTCSVDVQVGFFEWLCRGWGINGESWIVDRGRILADAATNPSDWDKLPAQLFLREWPLADGSGRTMGVRASCIDSAGAAGVTQQAYAAWARWRRTKIVRYFGKTGGPTGRDVFNIILTKGAIGFNKAKLSVVYPDTPRAANLAAGRGEIPLATFNPNLFKDDLLGHLLKAEPGDWFVHFPAGASAGFPHGLRAEENQPPHPWFEQLTAEARLPDGKWQLVSPSARNEALDLMVMSHVIAHLHGLMRIKWERPPVWAADWDHNPMIRAAVPAVAPELPVESLAPAAPAAPAGVRVTVDQARQKSIGKRLA